MIRTMYSWLARAVQPLLRRKLARRGVAEPGYLVAIEERFGHYDVPVWPDDGRTLWVHAVSLGETRAAAVLLRELRERWPGYRLLLTHGTATGRAEGARLLRPGDLQVWQPWDTPEAVTSFLQHFHPRVGVLLETEVWPNLTATCVRAGVPLVLANARLSARSLRRALRLAWLARPAYRALSAVWAQTDDDARHLRLLGAPVAGVFGNLKFDATPDGGQLQRARAWRTHCGRPVVMFASSREGEEVLLLDALRAMGERAQAVQWLIVPRHPQRFDEVQALVEAAGLSVSRRSSWTDGPASAPPGAAVWLGDSLGEMALYYGLSDAALLGGSFAPLGGQNLIEAAACACPVLMGPHTFNFSEAAMLAEQAGAAQRCQSLTEAVTIALQWLAGSPASARSEEREQRVRASLAFAQAHRGATARTCDALQPYLD